MDWTSIGTILATGLVTGLVTVGSVWLKGQYDLRLESERLKAQAEAAKVERELDERREAENRSRNERAVNIQAGATALAAFSVILKGLSSTPDTTSPADMEKYWNEEFDAHARQVVEGISDSQAREDMLTLVSALGNFEDYSTINGQKTHGGFNARILIRALIELAGAVSRGEAPSAELRSKMDYFAGRVQAVYDYYQNNV